MFGIGHGIQSSNRTGIYPSSKFLRIPFHQSSGTSIPYTTHDGDGALTWANEWSDYRANPAGATGYVNDTQVFDDIFNLSTLSGGLLIMFTTYYPSGSPPSATEKILQYGAPSRTSPGGIYIGINATNVTAVVTPTDTGEASANTLRAHSHTVAETHCIYIDMAHGLMAQGINGAWNNADEHTGIQAIADAGKLPSVTSGLYAFSLFCQNGSGGAENGQILNSGTGDVSVSDLWAVRFETDKLTSIPGIFQEYTRYPRSNLRLLDGI